MVQAWRRGAFHACTWNLAQQASIANQIWFNQTFQAYPRPDRTPASIFTSSSLDTSSAAEWSHGPSALFRLKCAGARGGTTGRRPAWPGRATTQAQATRAASGACGGSAWERNLKMLVSYLTARLGAGNLWLAGQARRNTLHKTTLRGV